jgi:hypothetical protein
MEPGEAIVTLLSPVLLAQEVKMADKSCVVLNLNLPAAVGYEPVTLRTGALKTTGEAGALVVTSIVVAVVEEGEMLVGVQ